MNSAIGFERMARQPKLLLVDDDKAMLAVLQLQLEEAGFEVESANSGFDALRKLEQNRYDLLLLDQLMPGLHGIEVVRLIRQTHSMQRLPIILMSAESGADEERRALTLGANDFITKPVELAVVIERIENQLYLDDDPEEVYLGIGAAI